ncbi:hypothetical protein BIV23_23995 [Streptomyces monashensis]|uniref:Uncharacterized protein n=1 Tax=Streptomyces monashensis TaxID=1678012 RepID=A0A1S2Q9Z0_9ACTN|nr:hypothetical protein BIV23_23995 [Streptomyces monashensis]
MYRIRAIGPFPSALPPLAEFMENRMVLDEPNTAGRPSTVNVSAGFWFARIAIPPAHSSTDTL